MDIDERFVVDAPVDRVWPLLRDIDTVAECFPGAELTGQEDSTYDGRIAMKFGPTKVTFAGRATIDVRDDDRSATINARGKDGRKSSGAVADVVVRARDDGGRTEVVLSGTIDVTGPLGGFASSGGAHVTRLMLEDFAAAVSERVAPATPEPVATVAEPAAGPAATPAAAPAAAAHRSTELSVTQLVRRLFADWVRRLRGRRSSAGAAR